jgi:hypothetical protein
MAHFWSIIFILFTAAFLLAEILSWLERKFSYYASKR